jgi:hypothetical protein
MLGSGQQGKGGTDAECDQQGVQGLLSHTFFEGPFKAGHLVASLFQALIGDAAQGVEPFGRAIRHLAIQLLEILRQFMQGIAERIRGILGCRIQAIGVVIGVIGHDHLPRWFSLDLGS